mgnify:CR=1 FL=1
MNLQQAIRSGLNPVEHLASTLGHNDKSDIRFRERILRKLPIRFLSPVASQYQQKFETQGRREANLMLLGIGQKLDDAILPPASTDEDIRRFAKLRAEACRKVYLRASSLNEAYRSISAYVRSFGLEALKVGRKYDLYGAVMRMADEFWWRRRLRKTFGRSVETIAIGQGLVRKQAGIYASDETVSRRTEQKARVNHMLDEMEAVNELDQSYTLRELQALSVSNPKIRRSELMTRIAGFEEYAQDNGHIGLFCTITCPSRMHPRLSRSGEENPKYDGTTPDQAQAYLNKQWSKIRAAFQREEIAPYGFRVAEPQHDATPHWHLLIFLPPEQAARTKAIMRHYALEIDGQEPGADQYRFDAKNIDWSKGTAAGYIAKYISKNIDGHGVDLDLHGHDAKDSAIRVDAWKAVWGIRQFQQIGGPPVTIWRILRNLSDVPTEGLALEAYQAADQGDWRGYMEIMGGHTLKKSDWPIGLLRRDIETLNRYGEPIGQAIVGVTVGQETYRSKIHIWEIRLKPASDDPYTDSRYVNVTLRNVTDSAKATVLEDVYIEGSLEAPTHDLDQDLEQPRNRDRLSEKRAGFDSGPLEFCQ